MKELPTPEIYEKEFKYMPWGELIEQVLDYLEQETPRDAKVLDLMCGPGYLLGRIKQLRPDLDLTGVDIDERYIHFAKDKYPNIKFEVSDSLLWNTSEKFDLIICTAGLHHLPYEKQEEFIEKVSKFLAEDGFCVFADPYIDDYSSEQERQMAASKLGYEYLVDVIEKNAPREIISATVDILYNDVMKFEFKNSIEKNKVLFHKYFSFVETNKTWPKSDSGYGDYWIVLKK